ncbi:MAG: DGQHR domain-containing protein [Cytophagales bacterium]|nr:DGQHR domain-containing protein [Cytophagales bacterium]
MKPEDQKINIKCFKVMQPLGEFYIGVINHEDLIKISYADIRRLETGNEQREVEVYTGIQRPLSKNRVKEIGKYVNLVDATFPTSVILHIESTDIEFNEKESILLVPFRDNVAKVIDGQHRIAGLEDFSMGGDSFQINVTIFVGMELEDQAIVFATINKTQTKVNKSLVADLFSFAKHRSPQKTAHSITRALNQKEGSPFYKKIKILGTANDKEKETITQATFSESLIKFFSKDQMEDRDIYKRGKKPEKFEGKELISRPFRNIFIDEEDWKIAKIIWNYFDAVNERWPNAWTQVKQEMILNKSTGFVSLMRFLKDAYLYFDRIGEIIEKDDFLTLLNRIEILESDFNRENYIPGSGGQSKLYKELLESSGIKLTVLNNG